MSIAFAHSCRASVSVPGPSKTVQRAELWGVILALQSADAVHIGVENLGVVRHVGRLLDDCSFSTPLELVTDGDLLILLRRMIDLRGRSMVRVTKVKGHADEGMASDGRVRELVRLGNNAADEVAGFGRGRVGPAVLDARRKLSGVCGRWYPVLLDLHRFFIAISRAVVNHDGFGGTAPDPMVWSTGPLPKRRRIVHAVRDLALLLGPLALWDSEWVASPSVALDADDVAQWPYTPGLLVKWVSFLGSLHWPAHGGDLGVGGISYVELLILYELWAGERLVLEKAHLRYLRPGRLISVSAVPFGPGIDIGRSCRFIGAAMRSLCLVVLVVSCHALLVLITAGFGILVGRGVVMGSLLVLVRVLLALFWTSYYCFFITLPGALLAGSLPLQYCFSRFAFRTPFWVLPVPRHVAGLVTVEGQAALVGRAEVAGRVSGLGGKRFRLNRKTLAHLVGHCMHARPRVWRRLHCFGYPGVSDVDCKRRRCNQQDDDGSPVHPRTGVG